MTKFIIITLDIIAIMLLVIIATASEEEVASPICEAKDYEKINFTNNGVIIYYDKYINGSQVKELIYQIDPEILDRKYTKSIDYTINWCLCADTCDWRYGLYNDRDIQIFWRGHDEHLSDTYGTTLHEIGHGVWYNRLSRSQRRDYCEIYEKYNSTELFATGKANCKENFAENFKFYFGNKEIMIREKREFMENVLQ